MDAILSPEELAAIEDYDADEAMKDEAEDGALDDEDDDTDAADDDADDVTGDDADGEDEDAPVAAEPEQSAKAEPAPVVDPQPVAEAEPSALDKLEADLADVKKQFDDGDISIDEYIDAKSALERKIVKAELKAELAQEAASKSWGQSQEEFLGKHDYLRDEVIYGAFATQVNKLLADPKSASMTDEALLAAAKAKVDTAFGRKPADSEPPKGESPIRKAKKEAAKAAIPKTLAGVPSARAADVGQDEFAHLDALSGEKREAAVARMTPEQQSRWLHQ